MASQKHHSEKFLPAVFRNIQIRTKDSDNLERHSQGTDRTAATTGTSGNFPFSESVTPTSKRSDVSDDVYESIVFTTPENKPISELERIIWTPTSKVSNLEEVEQRLIDDGLIAFKTGDDNKQIEDERGNPEIVPKVDFITDQTDLHCLYFIYAQEFFWEKSPDERIEKVKACLSRVHENGKYCPRNRLRRIMDSNMSDKILTHNEALEQFADFGSTVRMFFETDLSFGGGFPMEPFERFQKSSNCYIVAACTWYTLILQKRMPHLEGVEIPIDIAQVTRRLVIRDDEALEKRILQDGGGSAHDLARKLTGTYGSPTDNSWVTIDSESFNAEVLASALALLLETHHYGLISIFLNDAIKNAMKVAKPTGLGYWKFDGLSIDCEAQFVSLEPDEECEKERKRFQEKWHAIPQDGDDSRNKCCAKEVFSRCFADRQNHQKQEPSEFSAKSKGERNPVQKHAMVLMGGYKEVVDKKTKYLFLLLNSWSSMPLLLLSSDYLIATGASVRFLKPKTQLHPEKWDRKAGQVGETSFVDGGDDGSSTLFYPGDL